MPLHDPLAMIRPVRVALLTAHRWLESPIVQALVDAGLQVTSHGDAVGFATGLQRSGGDAATDIALVEDHERLFQDAMTTLRFRGTAEVPVFAIGTGSTDEIRSALQHGAADYVVRTDAMASMVNRVLARLAVARQGSSASLLRVGDCWLEAASRSLQFPNGEIQLTPREFALAWVLFDQAGQVVSMKSLSQQAWGRDDSIAKRTIEQHVSRLRAKLVTACADADRQLSLQAVHNIGYRLVVGRPATAMPAVDSGFGALVDPGAGWARRRGETAVVHARR